MDKEESEEEDINQVDDEVSEESAPEDIEMEESESEIIT